MSTILSICFNLLLFISILTQSYATTTVCGTAASEDLIATLTCPSGNVITAINFASYGTPSGSCVDGFIQGSCHATTSVSVVSSACLNRATCSVSSSYQLFTYDPCIGTRKHLYIKATCGPSDALADVSE